MLIQVMKKVVICFDKTFIQNIIGLFFYLNTTMRNESDHPTT